MSTEGLIYNGVICILLVIVMCIIHKNGREERKELLDQIEQIERKCECREKEELLEHSVLTWIE